MTTDIDVNETTILATDRLKRTGEEYALVSLSARHIDRLLTLQDTGFASLAATEQHYLIRKDRAFFENHFAAGNNVVGIVHQGRLVAQCVIVNPTAARSKTGMRDMNLNVPLDSLSILQGVIVDPAYRGNNLMGAMVDAWLAESAKNGRTELLAEAATENSFSWSVFLKRGMHIESIGVDKSDGTKIYNLHGHIPALSAIFNESAKKAVCPQTDLAQQKKLFAAGYKGAGFNPANGNLEFRRAKKNMRCL